MGGIERYLTRTVEWLGVRGEFEPIAVCCDGTPLYNALAAMPVKVYGLPGHGLFAKSFWRSLDVATFIRLYRILKLEKPDIVHAHIGLVELLLFKVLGYPVILTFHGYDTLYSSENAVSPPKRVFKALTRWLFRQTVWGLDALLFVSRSEQSRMGREGYVPPEKQGEVLHNGLPIAELNERAKAVHRPGMLRQLGLPANARCVAFINRLDANKNPLQFIEMACQILQQAPEPASLHFLVVGDGPLAPRVQAECAALPNVHYLGYRPDVPELLAVSDVLVYPALREGFGLGLVEAMAAGALCVAYASGGALEILDTRDFPELRECLVPIGDFDALRRKTIEMLAKTEPEAERLRQAQFQRVSVFDGSRFIARLESVYTRLAPKVSVILPVFNGESIILRAVHSVLNQTYPHLELIVVDDGSTDGTLAQLAKVDDPRLKIFAQPNQGVAVARNFGFTCATGDYIAFIDADDIWLRHKLATELKTIRAQSPDSPACLVYSSYYAVDESDALINLPGIFEENGDLSQVVLEHEGIFLPSTALVHRQVFEAVGGFKQACYHEDRVFFIEACRQFPAYSTGQRLVIYRQSLSGRCRSVLKHYEQALEAELSIVETLRPVLSKDEIDSLSIRQMRNLLYRFLMYNYTEQARELHARMQREQMPPDLFSGKKGRLALLSLRSGINFLAGARLFIQGIFRQALAPWWFLKMRDYKTPF